MLALFAGSLVFAFGGIFLIVFVKGDPEALVAGVASVLFFGACAVIGAVMLLPGAGSLTLDVQGFEVCSLFRRNRIAWPQASRFTVATLSLPDGNNKRMVGYDDDGLKGFGAEFSRDAIGSSAALPDTYGLSFEELALLMIEWRERALAQRPIRRCLRSRSGGDVSYFTGAFAMQPTLAGVAEDQSRRFRDLRGTLETDIVYPPPACPRRSDAP